MININNYIEDLNNIVKEISNITGMESAIFDTNYKLVTSTEMYHNCKGDSVHTKPLKEVLINNTLIVQKPGTMESCLGCRFVNNCPSKIEFLVSIKNEFTPPLGVISLASFSNKNIDYISNNFNDYILLLKDMSNLIALFVFTESNRTKLTLKSTVLDELAEFQNEIFITCNEHGKILNTSRNISKIFPNYHPNVENINSFMPEKYTNWIFYKQNSKANIHLDNFSGTINKIPIHLNEEPGFLIQFVKNKNEHSNSKNLFLDKIITNNEEMIELKKTISKISSSPSSVLITGDTGTGKELIAKAIHYTGDRKDYPFIPINCANIPDNLFESELYGYEEGAFTGARKGGKPGLIELAKGGTLFLDEINGLPIHLQPKLLRTIQEKSFMRVGSLEYVETDVRIICATNTDLEVAIANDEFRADLYYRINVIPIFINPLVERSDDIEILANHFLNKYNLILKKDIDCFSPEAIELLRVYNWPGNIRELENAIEYTVNMEDNNIISIDSLPYYILNYEPDNSNFNNEIKDKECEIIINTINKYGWDVKGKEKAAKELDMSLRTLYRKLKHIENV